MTSDVVIWFFLRQPFIPFEMYLTDGRVLRVPHPETASVGGHALTVRVVEDGGQVETVDVALIVSLRTLEPADADD